jgi:hypothetical protein
VKRVTKVVFWPAILLAIGSGVAAKDYPPAGFQIVESQESPRGGFKLIHYKKDPKDFSSESQIWLEPIKSEFKRQHLFTHHNRSYWLIDESDSHIAIGHHEYSSDNLLWLFVREPDGQFRQIQSELRSAALKEMCRKTGVQKTRDDFDHFDCYSEVWLRGGLLLAYIRGDSHTQGFYLKPWYFIYDADQNKFAWDDFESNKEALVTEKK